MKSRDGEVMKMFAATAMTLLLLFAGAPLLAQDRATQLTIWGSLVEMEGETTFDGDFETELEEGSGFGISANRFFGTHVSVEVAAFNLRSDASLVLGGDVPFDLGRLDLLPISVGGQFHILGRSRFDPYIGAGGAYVIAEDLHSPDIEVVGLGVIELENQFTYYLNAGIGVQITDGFGLVIDARSIPYEPVSRSTTTGVEQELEISPMIYSLGVRLQF